jgi:hypothetical protein
MALTPRSKKPVTPSRGIVKQSVTKIPTRFYINAAAGFVATLIVVLAVRGAFWHEPTPACSERLGNGTLFGLEDQKGGAISTTDLQSRLGGRDWGLVENTKIQMVKDGPAPVAMLVTLPKLPVGSDADPRRRSGMGFTWLLSRLSSAKAACLTYDIRLPEDFDFGGGGVLPGLFGGETTASPAKGLSSVFSTRHAWGENGTTHVEYALQGDAKGAALPINPDYLKLDRGRWIRLEQEVVLNDPGETNGIFRVWVDGKLQVEEIGVVFRKDDRAQFRGVIADVHYGTSGVGSSAVPKSTTLQVTPFILRWQ